MRAHTYQMTALGGNHEGNSATSVAIEEMHIFGQCTVKFAPSGQRLTKLVCIGGCPWVEVNGVGVPLVLCSDAEEVFTWGPVDEDGTPKDLAQPITVHIRNTGMDAGDVTILVETLHSFEALVGEVHVGLSEAQVAWAAAKGSDTCLRLPTIGALDLDAVVDEVQWAPGTVGTLMFSECPRLHISKALTAAVRAGAMGRMVEGFCRAPLGTAHVGRLHALRPIEFKW